ncbi:MAG: M23 family metallopeptidase [Burkholderiaceae bacterium]
MTLVLIAQLLVPVLLVLWLLVSPPGSRLGWAVQGAATLLVLATMTRIGIWLFPPWWTPHAAAALALGAAMLRWPRTRPLPWLPQGLHGWIVASLFGAMGAGATLYGGRALAGAAPPTVPAVSLAWPLQGARLLVANGGNDLVINSHLASLLSDDPRFVPWRGNRWAVDIVAIDALGLRSTGFMPQEPARYRVFGMPVLAPCGGTVAVAVDGLPDMPVPEYDRAHLAGNHVILDCDGVHVVLAPFKRGSVRVSVGDPVQAGAQLAQVGNSGGSNEPHLHIHAQRPGPATQPMGGDPLPLSFGGRFLVRGDRIDPPGRHR